MCACLQSDVQMHIVTMTKQQMHAAASGLFRTAAARVCLAHTVPTSLSAHLPQTVCLMYFGACYQDWYPYSTSNGTNSRNVPVFINMAARKVVGYAALRSWKDEEGHGT